MNMNHSRTLKALLASVFLGGVAFAGGIPGGATGPAITTIKIGVDGGNSNDFAYYGQSGGIAAYSIATTSCNPGTQVVQWTSSDHPVISTNIMRLKDGRFEHLGQSWLKHGFCAVNESGCGTCQSTSCATLGIGCADTYWATLNDGQGGGPKYQVNAATGTHQHPYPSPSGPSTIRGRLQVLTAEIDPNLNTGAVYFSEAQYVSQHTAQNGNGSIANSWRKLNVVSVSNVDGGGPTIVGEPAPYAWKSVDDDVNVFDVYSGEFNGSGRYTIAYKVTDLGGSYRYDYVVENVSSDRSAFSFSIPAPDGTAINNVFFRDVDYHSGEPFANTDWTTEHAGGFLTWKSTQTFAQNQNSNALRWGTMYTFGFESTSAPQNGSGQLEMFKPGTGNDTISFSLASPTGEPPVGTAFCSGDGTGTFCPCFNFGDTGHGCSNSTFFQGCELRATGDASVSNDTLVLDVVLAISDQPGLFFQGSQQVNGGDGAVFGDGLRCVSGTVFRLEIVTPTGAGVAQSTIDIGASGQASAGETLYYQFWYRDPNLSPCSQNFNLSNGLEVTWSN